MRRQFKGWYNRSVLRTYEAACPSKHVLCLMDQLSRQTLYCYETGMPFKIPSHACPEQMVQGRSALPQDNSLSGEPLHASWDCVAEFGKRIELGKRDVAGGASLPTGNFLESRSYCCADMTHMTQKRPRRARA